MPTVLITGTSRGLGFEFVRQYSADGWTVIATCRQPAKAQKLEVLRKENKNIQIETLDVTDLDSVNALANKLKGAAIDMLINNAGIYSGGSVSLTRGDKFAGQDFGALDAAAWETVLKVNVISPIMVTQAFVPHLSRGKDRKIIMISSKMGSIELMGKGSIAYRTSKAALNAAMRSIALDLQAEKMIVASLHPGWVQTDMGGPQAAITAETSVSGMRKVIAELSLENTGEFIAYDGTALAW